MFTRLHLSEVSPDGWSDSDEEDAQIVDPPKRIRTLERKLAQAKQDFVDYRALITQKMDLLDVPSEAAAGQTPAARDDDTHYFKSYAENGSFFCGASRSTDRNFHPRYTCCHDQR